MEPAGKPPLWLEQLLARVEADPTRRWKDEDLRRAELDPGRVRRWFLRHHGITFHAYQRARRLGLALGHIRHGEKWEGVGYTHGFDSASGFHEAFSKAFDRAPQRGKTLAPLVLSRLLTPLGPMLAGATSEGICLLEFADRRMLETQINRLSRWFDCAVVPGEHEHIAKLERELELYFAGKIREFTVPLVLRGTPFQVAAWERLLTIPYGETISYERQARAMNRPGAQRAVGKANGDNRMAILIPCQTERGSVRLRWWAVEEKVPARPRAQHGEQEQCDTERDARIGNVEGIKPRVSKSDVDEVDHAAGGTDAINHVSRCSAADERQRQHREAILAGESSVVQAKHTQYSDGKQRKGDSRVWSQRESHRCDGVVSESESEEVADDWMGDVRRREVVDRHLLCRAIQREQTEQNWPEGEGFLWSHVVGIDRVKGRTGLAGRK
jgi:AraC family transcriptional regulator of adaptative response/methylated-DNA-[protein]-cysteine methyltransferase